MYIYLFFHINLLTYLFIYIAIFVHNTRVNIFECIVLSVKCRAYEKYKYYYNIVIQIKLVLQYPPPPQWLG